MIGTAGGGSNGLSDWKDSSSSHCSFSGVTCDEDGEVVSLDVSYQNLTGSLPPEIGILRSLSKINISGNNIDGGIPPEISNCTSLISLDFSRNNLSGEIPRGMDQLKDLNHLDLSENQLTGGVPSEMQYMSSLTSLNLSGNKLSGRVPNSGQLLMFDESSYAGNSGLCFSYNGTCSSQKAKANAIENAGHKTTTCFSTLKLVIIVLSLCYQLVQCW
ncbi:unnamed protein product [Linum tenue]|uniref:Leucine-rich repeat-containing N-terminal plant-type domain-containing protein n=1 Tax=Linum tenue TaxID=586396 RepID=A0AAV0S5V7_9ROSI|nr:unnamed protein product [Linum tenue]